MMHATRRFCVSPVASVEELARMLTQTTWTLCSGFYAEGHPAILKMPMTMAKVMLTMDRWPLFRDRAIRALASEPALFSRLLGVHMGEESLPRFVYEKGLHLGLQILAPAWANL